MIQKKYGSFSKIHLSGITLKNLDRRSAKSYFIEIFAGLLHQVFVQLDAHDLFNFLARHEK